VGAVVGSFWMTRGRWTWGSGGYLVGSELVMAIEIGVMGTALRVLAVVATFVAPNADATAPPIPPPTLSHVPPPHVGEQLMGEARTRGIRCRCQNRARGKGHSWRGRMKRDFRDLGR
jgi:hypothetical protein